MSKVYSFKTIQFIPTNLNTAWDFFSNPANLQTITPRNLGFKIISKHHGHTMYAGQLIEYKVSPVLGIPLYWMTEITHVQDKQFFVDEQRFGPYALWHHQHHFEETEDGKVLMKDIVNFKLPFGILGDFFASGFVKNKVKFIFESRFKILEEIFS